MDIMVKLKKLGKDGKMPRRATNGSSGYDVFAYRVLDKETKKVISDLREPVEIKPGKSVLFGIGVALEIPETHHAVIVSRSGLGSRYDVEVGYTGAPIDSDYRGEASVLLRNFGEESFLVGKNMRIAQMVFYKKEISSFMEVKKLSKTERGDRGLGSTGFY